jgi:two-component system response regulator
VPATAIAIATPTHTALFIGSGRPDLNAVLDLSPEEDSAPAHPGTGISLAPSKLYEPGGDVSMTEKTEGSSRPGPARRVLVVEDDGSYRWVLRRLIESAFGEEVAVEETPTGEAALERAASDPALDLILLDINLPGVDGIEVLRRLRAEDRTRRVPVIVVTSSQEESVVRRAYEAGANSFVSKSDSPEKTLQRLRLLPVYWLELNRLPDETPDAGRRDASSASSRSKSSSAGP